MVDDEREFIAVLAEPEVEPARPRLRTQALASRAQSCARESPRSSNGCSALLSLVLGLSMLAALPVVQFLSLGYFLESSARVARSGRIRDGFVGVRKAARVGGVTAGIWLSLVPTWLVGIVRPLGRVDQPRRQQRDPLAHRADRGDRAGAAAYRRVVPSRRADPVFSLAVRPSLLAGAPAARKEGCTARPATGSGRSRRACAFPITSDWGWSVSLARWPGLPFRALLIAAVGVAPLLAPIGMLLLAIVVPFLPFLQVRYALEGHALGSVFAAGHQATDSAARRGRLPSRCSCCCSPRFRCTF